MPHYDALSKAVRDARTALLFSQRKVAELAGVSLSLVQAMETGEERSYQPAKKRQIEDALQRPRGWIDQILRDGYSPGDLPRRGEIQADLTPRERIARMEPTEVREIAKLIIEATGNSEAALDWVEAANQIRQESTESAKTDRRQGA
ncbi:helix-turn-helix transcriptional regulator [Amycolatopsis sp. NPDC006131]|uniref:helix-turn-helix domain-containing protein n=1 Tax=Amycolatopsis sp. NPDC006131 TaxID=3156731 RepID=UPI0033B87F5D